MDNVNQTIPPASAYVLGEIVFAELAKRDGAEKAAAFADALNGATRPGTPERAAQDAAWSRLMMWFDGASAAPNERGKRGMFNKGISAAIRSIAPGETVIFTEFDRGRISVEASRIFGPGVISCRTRPDGVHVTRKAAP